MKIYFGGDGKMRAVAESEDDVRELLAMKDRKPVEKEEDSSEQGA